MKSGIDWKETPIESFESITGERIEEAVELVRPHIAVSSTAEIAREDGARIVAKFESGNPTGAFKVRGGLVYFDWLRAMHPEITSVIAATRGNHGQSIAFAAGKAGISAKIVVPFGNSKSKNEAMRQLGAEVIEHGRDFADAMDFGSSEAEATGGHYIQSFDWKLVLGVSTYGHELFSAHPDIDVVYVPIGLGSGICGTIAARNAVGSTAKVIGVVAEKAPAYARSFEAGTVLSSDDIPDTIADGVALRVPNPAAFSVIQQHVDEVVMISEAEIRAAIRELHTTTGKRIEGAGAIGYAAWLAAEKDRFSKPAVIISGGNIDDGVFAEAINQV